MSPDQHLAKAEPKPPSLITTPAEYQAKLEQWAAHHYNVLSPFTTFTGLQEGFGLMASRVSVDPDPKRGEVYDDVPWVAKGHVALAKVGLRKIAECAGMSTTVARTDPYTIPHYWEVKATARWRGLDGSIIEREAPFEWDMRDGSPRTKGFTPKQIDEARKHGLRHCSTRAVNAAIREYGVKQTYTKEEMAKPFVVIRVVFMPDLRDPDVRRIMAENALAGTSSLYAQAHAPQLPSAPVIVDAFSEDEPTEPTKTAGNGATRAATASNLPAGFGLIQKVETEQKKRKNSESTFTKWRVIDFEGVEHVTIKKEFGEALYTCWMQTVAVRIESTENDYNENEITGFVKHEPDQPQQQGSLLPRADQL